MPAEHPSETLRCLAKENSIEDITSTELANLLDKQDKLSKIIIKKENQFLSTEKNSLILDNET